MSAEHRQERLERQSGRTIAGRVFFADGDKGVHWRASVVVEEFKQKELRTVEECGGNFFLSFVLL